MKKLVKTICISILGLSLFSCASTDQAVDQKSFSGFKEAVAGTEVISEIKLGKKAKGELNCKKSNLILDEKTNKEVPFALYKVNLEKDKTYSLTLKSYPNGLMAADSEDKSVVIPSVYLFDENMNVVENLDYSGRATAPTNLDPLLFKVLTDWKIENSGTYYFAMVPDMTSELGIIFLFNGYRSTYQRTTDGDYKIVIEEKVSKSK